MPCDAIKARPIIEIIDGLRERSEPPPLEPKGAADSGIKDLLDNTTVESLFEGVRVGSNDFAHAVKSGLYLWNDCLKESHRISQKIESETGSFWHAIMHRREPDFSNSKYGWGKVGQHPLFADLHGSALQILAGAEGHWNGGTRGRLKEKGRWLPLEFVDWCEACSKGGEGREILEAVQLEEIQLLLEYSYVRAVS